MTKTATVAERGRENGREKEKKSFFPRENWRQDTIILVMNISFLVWTSQRSRNVKQLDGATIKLIFYTTLSRYKHPVASWFLFFAKIVCRITTFKATRPCMYYKKSETFIAIPQFRTSIVKGNNLLKIVFDLTLNIQ